MAGYKINLPFKTGDIETKLDKEVRQVYTFKYRKIDAGWSSLEARWAHNPKAAGSNPAPAIEERAVDQESQGLFFFV